MANGFDCKEHRAVLESITALEKNDIQVADAIKHLEGRMDKREKNEDDFRKALYDMPIKIIFWTVGLLSAINGALFYVLTH